MVALLPVYLAVPGHIVGPSDDGYLGRFRKAWHLFAPDLGQTGGGVVLVCGRMRNVMKKINGERTVR